MPNFSRYSFIGWSSQRARCISKSLGTIMNSLWAPRIFENIWNLSTIEFYIFDTKVTPKTIHCTPTYIYAKAQFKQKEDILYVCISFLPLSSSSYFLWYSIFLHMFCNITHSISYDFSFLPLFVINLARSPQMIGSCCQTPCDHINLSLWRYQFMMVSIYLFDDINSSLW